jgi:hypothetical protein
MNNIELDDVSFDDSRKVPIKDNVCLISITLEVFDVCSKRVRFSVYINKEDKECSVSAMNKDRDKFRKDIMDFLSFVATLYASVIYPNLFIDTGEYEYD